MNVQLKDITMTARDGRVSHLDQVYIRGSHVRFFIVPDMLRYALITSSCSVPGGEALTILGMLQCSVKRTGKAAV
jgi:small nuclear ribonucleoprotein D3